MKLNVTYIIRQFSLFVANTSDVSIKYLYSSFSFSINIKTDFSDQNINWCTVCTVGLTVSATGTEGGAYCECNRDRGTADRLLVTIAIAAIDIQHYTLTGVPSVLWVLL